MSNYQQQKAIVMSAQESSLTCFKMRTILQSIMIIIMLSPFIFPVQSAETEPVSLSLVDQWPGFPRNHATDIAVQGDYAYLAASDAGLMILDVRDPANPHRVGGIVLEGNAASVAVAGEHAYVLTWIEDDEEGSGISLNVVDISHPTHPVRQGSYIRHFHLSGYYSHGGAPLSKIFANGDSVYMAAGDHLWIINVSDPTRPSLRRQRPLGARALDIVVSGNLAFIASDDGLKIYDVTNPDRPTRLAQYETENTCFSIAVHENLTFVGGSRINGQGGLLILDVSVPEKPVSLVDEIEGEIENGQNHGWYVRDVEIHQDHLYVSTHTGIQILDITPPTSPKIITSYPSSHTVTEMYFSGEVGYWLDAPGDIIPGYGLTIVDVFQVEEPKPLGRFNTSGESHDVSIVEDRAYLADGTHGLQVFDISDASSPLVLDKNTSAKNDYTFGLEAGASLLMTQGLFNASTEWFETADPDQLWKIRSISEVLPPFFSTTDAYFHEGLAYLTGRWSEGREPWTGLFILNIENPLKPVLLGELSEPSSSPTGANGFQSIAVSGTNAFVHKQSRQPRWTVELKIIDVSDVGNPEITSSLQITPNTTHGGFVQNFVVAGNHVYVSTAAYVKNGYTLTGELQIIDAGDPTNPILAGKFPTGEAPYFDFPSGIAFHEQKIYIAGRSKDAPRTQGMYVLDVNDPAKPFQIGWFETDEPIHDIEVRNHHVYLSNGRKGLLVLEESQPLRLAIDGGFPLSLNIQGGQPPYQLQVRQRIERGKWKDEGPVIMENNFPILYTGSTKFYQAISLAGLSVENFFRDNFSPEEKRPVTWFFTGMGDEYVEGLRELTEEGWVWTPTTGSMAAQVEGLSYKNVSLYAQLRHRGSLPDTSGYTYLVFAGYFCGIHPTGKIGVWKDEWLAERPTDLDPIKNDVHLHVTFNDGSLEMTAWEDGKPYPNSPQIFLSTQPFAGGKPGLFHKYEGKLSGVIWRSFQVKRLE